MMGGSRGPGGAGRAAAGPGGGPGRRRRGIGAPGGDVGGGGDGVPCRARGVWRHDQIVRWRCDQIICERCHQILPWISRHRVGPESVRRRRRGPHHSPPPPRRRRRGGGAGGVPAPWAAVRSGGGGMGGRRRRGSPRRSPARRGPPGEVAMGRAYPFAKSHPNRPASGLACTRTRRTRVSGPQLFGGYVREGKPEQT